MRDFATRPVRSWLVPALAVGALVLAAGGVDGFVHERVTAGPDVGSLIIFPAGAAAGCTKPRLAATRADGQPCVLDATTIRATGGSLLVLERIRADRLSFRLHWTGPRTAEGPDDCGTATDLWLDKRDVTALVNAAGGYGAAGGR